MKANNFRISLLKGQKSRNKQKIQHKKQRITKTKQKSSRKIISLTMKKSQNRYKMYKCSITPQSKSNKSKYSKLLNLNQSKLKTPKQFYKLKRIDPKNRLKNYRLKSIRSLNNNLKRNLKRNKKTFRDFHLRRMCSHKKAKSHQLSSQNKSCK